MKTQEQLITEARFLEDHIDEIFKYMLEDCFDVGFCGIVDAPNGDKQESNCGLFDFEWVDQSTGIAGDDYYGTVCFPLPSGKYLKLSYQA